LRCFSAFSCLISCLCCFFVSLSCFFALCVSELVTAYANTLSFDLYTQEVLVALTTNSPLYTTPGSGFDTVIVRLNATSGQISDTTPITNFGAETAVGIFHFSLLNLTAPRRDLLFLATKPNKNDNVFGFAAAGNDEGAVAFDALGCYATKCFRHGTCLEGTARTFASCFWFVCFFGGF
jgi:hypothetical protein